MGTTVPDVPDFCGKGWKKSGEVDLYLNTDSEDDSLLLKIKRGKKISKKNQKFLKKNPGMWIGRTIYYVNQRLKLAAAEVKVFNKTSAVKLWGDAKDKKRKTSWSTMVLKNGKWTMLKKGQAWQLQFDFYGPVFDMSGKPLEVSLVAIFVSNKKIFAMKNPR